MNKYNNKEKADWILGQLSSVQRPAAHIEQAAACGECRNRCCNKTLWENNNTMCKSDYNDHKRMDFSPGSPVYNNCELCKTCMRRCELMTEVTGLCHASFVRV